MSGRATPTRPRSLSVAVLAGGKSLRMGTDKAFLTYQSKPFVKIITEEMQQITDDLIVVIGSKKKSDFAAVLDPKVRILEDKQELGNPIGGMLTGFETAIHDHIAMLA
ncbi:MAG: NTP transferase domain-containing protein, partial [Thaumarchaeota archaeon]|nr:NTP transferase domain-containing protein [Nitrososphaerota archaeon]